MSDLASRRAAPGPAGDRAQALLDGADPAFPGASDGLVVVKELHGHSGCRLLLLDEGGGAYRVRKISGAAAYDSRLIEQRRKQADMAALGFPCPAVLDDGWLDGRYRFDMEYVGGQSLADTLEHGDNTTFRTVADALADTLERLAATAHGVLPTALFLEKIAAIAAAPLPGMSPRSRLEVREIATRLAALDWSGIPASLGHGDMTVENVLLRPDGALCFIDFLDGPLTSYWLDLAKLHQDLRGHWFQRNLSEEQRAGPRGLGPRIAASRLDALLRQRTDARWPGMQDRLTGLTQLQLFRIVPYCLSEATLAFVLRRIRDLDKDEDQP